MLTTGSLSLEIAVNSRCSCADSRKNVSVMSMPQLGLRSRLPLSFELNSPRSRHACSIHEARSGGKQASSALANLPPASAVIFDLSRRFLLYHLPSQYSNKINAYHHTDSSVQTASKYAFHSTKCITSTTEEITRPPMYGSLDARDVGTSARARALTSRTVRGVTCSPSSYHLKYI